MPTIISGARIVGPRAVFQGDIRIEEDRIAAVGDVGPSAGMQVIDGEGLYALPGFIDLHVHGGNGFDLTDGRFDARRERFDNSPKAYAESFPRLMKRFAENGVTRCLLATVAAPLPTLAHAMDQLARYAGSPTNGRDGARLEGAFLEGTFIMRPEYGGSLNPEHFFQPSCRLFDRLDRAARGYIRYVNVTPEFGRSAERLVRRLVRGGILAGLGHSYCDAEQVTRFAGLGLRVAIHFLNGPTGTSFKPTKGGNVIEAVLRSRNLYAEIIGDGFHVAPTYVREVIRRKGADRVVGVTDAIFPAGAKDIKRFRLGGIEAEIHPSGRYARMLGTPQPAYGSLLNMATLFGNFLGWLTCDVEGVWHRRHPAMHLDRALPAVARICAANPARVLGIDKSHGPGASPGTGTIQPGKCADIVLARLQGKPGSWHLRVKHTFTAGRLVYGGKS